MKALTKFERAQFHVGNHAFDEIAVLAKQPTRVARVVAVIRVYLFGAQLKFDVTNGTAAVLNLDERVKKLRCHAAKFHPLVLGSALAKLSVRCIQKILALPFFLSEFLTTLAKLFLIPKSRARSGNFTKSRVFPLLFVSGLSLGASSVFRSSDAPFLSLFFFCEDLNGSRSTTFFRLFHRSNHIMTISKLGEVL